MSPELILIDTDCEDENDHYQDVDERSRAYENPRAHAKLENKKYLSKPRTVRMVRNKSFTTRLQIHAFLEDFVQEKVEDPYSPHGDLEADPYSPGGECETDNVWPGSNDEYVEEKPREPLDERLKRMIEEDFIFGGQLNKNEEDSTPFLSPTPAVYEPDEEEGAKEELIMNEVIYGGKFAKNSKTRDTSEKTFKVSNSSAFKDKRIRRDVPSMNTLKKRVGKVVMEEMKKYLVEHLVRDVINRTMNNL